MRSPSILFAAALAALPLPLVAQHVAITPTVCTDNQLNGYWTTDTGSMVPGQWSALVVTTESLTQQNIGTLGFVVLSTGNVGCGVSLASFGLGPSCPGVPLDVPGPLVIDPAGVVLIAAVVPVSGRWCTHDVTVPAAALPAVGAITWTAQVVLYQSPAIAECWQATGNALTFAASW